MARNPFIVGNPVPADRFFGRATVVSDILQHLANRGQSSLVVGEARSGKSSLLKRLAHPDTLARLVQDWPDGRFVFASIDGQAFGADDTGRNFWTRALRPLEKLGRDASCPSEVLSALQRCRAENYDTESLEELAEALLSASIRLVLLVDELEAIVSHPRLGTYDFLSTLRSLSYNTDGALALVLASRRSRRDLNALTHPISRGSHFFNHLRERVLGALEQDAAEALLTQPGTAFSDGDRMWLMEATGCQPYLLQGGASHLWDHHQQGQPGSARASVQKSLLELARTLLSEAHRGWSEEFRGAFAHSLLQELRLLFVPGAGGRSEGMAPPPAEPRSLEWWPPPSRLQEILSHPGAATLPSGVHDQLVERAVLEPLAGASLETRVRGAALWRAGLEMLEATRAQAQARGSFLMPGESDAFAGLPLHLLVVGAPADRPHFEAFRTALDPVTRRLPLRMGSSYDVEPWETRQEALAGRLERARLVVALCTPDLWQNEECYALLTQARARAQQGYAQLLPLRVRPHVPDPLLEGLSPVPSPDAAISTASDPDSAWTEVAEVVERVLRHLLYC